MSGPGEDKDEDSSPGKLKSFNQLELTPEERNVLLQCRRQSLIRGVVAGGGSLMLLFWLKAQGRVPAAINKFPGFFYTMAFFVPFSTGAGSYRKICYQKIMSLENSTLKDAAMEIEKAYQTHKRQRIPERHYNRKQLNSPPPDSPSSVPRQHTPETPRQRTREAPSQQPLNVELGEGPSINMKTYSRDRSMLETKGDAQEQPDAFSGSHRKDDPGEFPDPPQEMPRKRGRTFDEIREENRLKNSQQRYPTSSQSGSSVGDERKRRNKYGDIIEP